jgi:hypothetical protein
VLFRATTTELGFTAEGGSTDRHAPNNRKPDTENLDPPAALIQVNRRCRNVLPLVAVLLVVLVVLVLVVLALLVVSLVLLLVLVVLLVVVALPMALLMALLPSST